MSSRWEVERAVLDSTLPAAARLVLLTLLTSTNDGGTVVSRQHGPSLTELARTTGLGRSSVARELIRLERDGWVVRERPPVHLARTKHARTRYRLTAPASPTQGPELVPQGDQASPTVAPDWSHNGTRLVPQGSKASPTAGHSPDSRLSQQQQPRGAQIVIDKTGATEVEAKAVLQRIQAEKKPRSMVGLLHRMAQDGDLAEWLSQVRANGHREATEEAARAPHTFEAGKSVGYCRRCGRYETNRIHETSAG